MTEQKKTELKVGIVSMLAIVILIVGISLGKGVNVSVSKQTLSFRFDNSGGITEGSPVVVNGVRRGNVTSVANHNGSVLIKADMNNISDIKSDAFAKITILEITGGKKIELYPGSDDMALNIKNEIPGRATADISDLVAILGDVSSDAISLVRNLDTISQGFNRILASGKLAEDIAEISQNTIELTANMNNLINDNYSKLQNTISDLSYLVGSLKNTYDKHEPNIDKIINDLDEALSQANSLLKKMDTTIETANLTLQDVQSITNEVKNGEGLAGKLLFDRNLAAEVDSTIKALGVLVNKINQHGVNVNVRLGTRP